MKQTSNSYESFKRDFEKGKPVIITILGVLVVGFFIFIYRTEHTVKNSNNDYKVQKFIWSTQDSLDDYHSENKSYPKDLNDIKIKHSNDSFTVINDNEIEYLGYRIIYSSNEETDYRLETNLKATGEKYIRYND